MIRRNPISAGTNHSEPLHQASFTAMKGIDNSKAVTVPNVVQNIENLVVNTDGSLSIRHPIVFKRTYDLNELHAEKIIPLHVPDAVLIVYTEDYSTYIAVLKDDDYCSVEFRAERLDYSSDVVLGVANKPSTKAYDVTNLLDLRNVGSVRTNTSTVLNNVTVNLNNPLVKDILFDSDLNTEDNVTNVFRYVQITIEDDVFKMTVKTPEVNTLDSGSEFVLNSNLTLDYPYATRDTYNSSYVSINGILPYIYCQNEDTPTDIYVEGDEPEDTYSYEHAYDTSYYSDVLPPTNPLLVEFLGNTSMFADTDYAFFYRGGVIRIWLNSFNFDSAPTVHANTPRQVRIALRTREFAGDTSKIRVDTSGNISGGYVKEYTATVERANYRGNAQTGYYIDITDTPFVGAVLGATKSNSDATFTYDVLSNTKYEAPGVPREEGEFRTKMRCSANDVERTQSIYTNFDSASGWTYYGAEGLFEIDLHVEATYDDVIEGAWDVYFNLHDFPGNQFAKTSFDKRAFAFQWYDPESPVQDNYTILISESKSQHSINNLTSDVSSKELVLGDDGDDDAVSIDYTLELSQYVHTRSEYMYVTIGDINLSYVKGTLAPRAIVKHTFTVPETAEGLGINCRAITSYGTDSDVLGSDTYTAEFTTAGNYVQSLKCQDTNAVSVEVYVSTVLKTPVLAGFSDYTVGKLTERVAYPRFQIADSVKNLDNVTVVLKAFMNLKPKVNDMSYYGVWEYSFNGVDWNSWYEPSNTGEQYFKLVKFPTYKSSEDIETNVTEYRESYGVLFDPNSEKDLILKAYYENGESTTDLVNADTIVPNRPDIAFLRTFSNADSIKFNTAKNVPINNVQFKFTVCTCDEDGVATVMATKDFVFKTALKWEFPKHTFGNAIEGDALLYNNRIYSFNSPSSKNYIFASDSNSFITPLSNIIDLKSSFDNTVKSLIPWRDYLIGFTEGDIHLITPSENGAFTKTVSTYIGVTEQDRKTCKAILNGIIFKSGNKVYTIYPNTSSGDETILNLNEVSHPINHVLEALPGTSYDIFSIGTERKYYTFIPYETYTYCIIYDYNLRVWYTNKYEGVRFTNYTIDSVNNITMYGVHEGILTAYYFENSLKEAYPDFVDLWGVESFASIPHGDFLTIESITPPAEGGFPNPEPIHFILDSGQRTDNISLTRKFVESKFLLATLNSKAAANLTVDVYVDGNPYKTRLKGDGIVFKEMPDDIITLGDESNSDDSDVYNSISQAFLRYSGKGKTIRHVIEGDSLYNFKLYEVFYRYRPMPNKQ